MHTSLEYTCKHITAESLHKVRQYHCRIWCTISWRLGKWAINYGQTSRRDIWVYDLFRGNILYCNSPRVGRAYMMCQEHRATQLKHTQLHWKDWNKLHVFVCIILASMLSQYARKTPSSVYWQWMSNFCCCRSVSHELQVFRGWLKFQHTATFLLKCLLCRQILI